MQSRPATTGRALCAALLIGAATLGSTASASPNDVDLLLELLYESGKLTQDERDSFRERMAQARQQREGAAVTHAPLEQPAEPVAPAAPVNVGAQVGYEPTQPLRFTDTRTQARVFRVESRDGANRFGIRGRVQIDSAVANWDDNLNVASSNVGAELPTRGTIVRRARFGALGIYDHIWEWQLELDFRDYEVGFANAYIAHLSSLGRLAIGHFKEPFSLESSTTSRRLTFLERATPVDAYRPSREIGVMFETIQPNYYLAGGFFGGEGLGIDRDTAEGYSVALRGSFAPIQTDKMFSHIGASANYRRNSVNSNTDRYQPVRLRSREGTRAIDVRLIGRDDIEGVEDFSRFALEGAWGYGPFSIQGEYLYVRLNLDPARGDVRTADSSISLDGFYVQASYFLTGEQRNYRAFSGDFGQLDVLRPLGHGGIGAWEVALRYAHADSMEHSRPGRGNKMDHITFGLNWYPNAHTVFKLNYMYFDYEGRGGTSNGNHVLAGRAQFEF